MLWTIIVMIVVGLIAGALARLIVPGRDALSVPATVLLGMVGSFVGGFLGWLLFNRDAADGALQPAGWVGSVIGAVIALLAYRAMNGKSLTHGRA